MLKMKDITIGMRLEDERTNTVFTVIEKNSKYKTVMLQAEDGTTRSTSIATIGKHFTEVVDLEDLATSTVEEQEEIKEEQVQVVETEEDEMTTWISKKKLTWKEMLDVFVEKEKSAKKERKARKMKKDIYSLVEYVMNTWEERYGDIKHHNKDTKTQFAALCAYSGRQVVKFIWTNTSIKFCVRFEDIKNIFDNVKEVNYTMPYQVTIKEFNVDTLKKIDTLFDMSECDTYRKRKTA